MIKIYDQDRKLVAILENAFNIGYSKRLNELWIAYFSLPADDPKNAECKAYRYVEIFDNGERVELFRILPSSLQKSDTTVITYQCEHVLATLIDDVMFQYHELGGVGIYTNQVLQYILDRQVVKRWVLGQIAFQRQFLYKWENENLLGALFSVPKPFIEQYKWAFDTKSYPWTLSLVPIDSTEKSYIRYRKNLIGITKDEDPTQLCTRLYCLGYGEGVNQLTIKDVNGGVPYLEDFTYTNQVISRIFVDRRYESPETLKASGQALLEKLKYPRISYTVDAVDLSSITKDDIDKFEVGTTVKVIDEEIGENFSAVVVGVSKSDIIDAPWSTQIEIANKPEDIASSIVDLADRQRINEVYSQGATNLDSHDYEDNCDPNNPARIRFYIPEETVRINKMTLSYETQAFRAYSKAIEGGGGVATSTSSGGGSETTSKSGGGGTSTSQSAGGLSDTSPVQVLVGGVNPTEDTVGYGTHNHGIPDGTRLLVEGGGSVGFRESGYHIHQLYNHGHKINIPSHSHTVNIPTHEHDVDIPSHRHDISIPDHIHDIEYGIYQGPTPSSVIVRVDGMIIPSLTTNETDIDIIPYLSKDEGGKIQRGTWHEITITPNNLGRITANVVTQLFVQSRGGGNY
ncbi:phage tail protein [Anaerosolibacter sp.]|uniref:phage tail protein n=1 Tax=Anaerosolibacter sp. TaxID=1872527 RepID=UPI0039EF3B84